MQLGKLIFHADDFGLLPQGDAAILELLQMGKLQGTSVLLSGLTDEHVQALKKLRQEQGIAIGLHLDAREVLAPGSDIEHEERLFFILCSGLRLLWSRSLRRRVFQAWHQQVGRFRSLFGFSPDQLEAHQHLNFHPLLFGYVCRLGAEFKVARIRAGRHNVPIRHWWRSPKALVINMLLLMSRWLTRGHRYGFTQKTTDSVFSIDWIFPYRSAAETTKALRALAAEKVEVIFHPARSLPGQKEYPILPERYQQYNFLQELNF